MSPTTPTCRPARSPSLQSCPSQDRIYPASYGPDPAYSGCPHALSAFPGALSVLSPRSICICVLYSGFTVPLPDLMEIVCPVPEGPRPHAPIPHRTDYHHTYKRTPPFYCRNCQQRTGNFFHPFHHHSSSETVRTISLLFSQFRLQ